VPLQRPTRFRLRINIMGAPTFSCKTDGGDSRQNHSPHELGGRLLGGFPILGECAVDGIESVGVTGHLVHQHVVDGGQLIIPNCQDGAAGEEVGVPRGVGELDGVWSVRHIPTQSSTVSTTASSDPTSSSFTVTGVRVLWSGPHLLDVLVVWIARLSMRRNM
jgi:hypothetical protein